MTTQEYMRRKNKILRDTIGLPFDLVPEDQIQHCEPMKLSMKLSMEYEGDNCPYCKVYQTLSDNLKCTACPMTLANNRCTFWDPDSTWGQYIVFTNEMEVDGFHGFPDSPAHEPIKELVAEYNKSNGFEE